MINTFRKIFGYSNKSIDINRLKEKIQNIRDCWIQIESILRSAGEIDPALIWSDEAKKFLEFMQSEVKVVRGIYKKNKRKYREQLANAKSLFKHLKKIKSPNNWVPQLEEYISKMQSGLEGIMAENENDKSLNPNAISRRTFLKRASAASFGVAYRGVVTAGVSLLTLKGVEAYLKRAASGLPQNNKDGLAILISKPRDIDELLGSYFIGIYMARMQLAFGFKSKYVITNATSVDFKKMLYDPSVQNICILGHGTNTTWQASMPDDASMPLAVSFDSMKTWYLERPSNKSGILIKHTCGNDIKESGTITFATRDTFYRLEEERKKFQEYVDSRLKNFPEEERKSYIKETEERIRSSRDGYERNLFSKNVERVKKMSTSEFRKMYLGTLPEKIYVVWLGNFGNDDLGYRIGELVLSVKDKPQRGGYYIGNQDTTDFRAPPGVQGKLHELNANVRRYLNYPKNQIEYPKLLGIPFFHPKNIMAWTRVTYIQDFLFNPFADTQLTFDHFSEKAMRLYEFLRGRRSV